MADALIDHHVTIVSFILQNHTRELRPGIMTSSVRCVLDVTDRSPCMSARCSLAADTRSMRIRCTYTYYCRWSWTNDVPCGACKHMRVCRYTHIALSTRAQTATS